MAQRSAFVYSPASSESCERRTGSRRLFGLVQLAQRWQSSAGSPSEEKKATSGGCHQPSSRPQRDEGGGVAQKAPEGRRRPVLVNKAPGTSRTQRARRSRRGRAGRGVRWGGHGGGTTPAGPTSVQGGPRWARFRRSVRCWAQRAAGEVLPRCLPQPTAGTKPGGPGTGCGGCGSHPPPPKHRAAPRARRLHGYGRA